MESHKKGQTVRSEARTMVKKIAAKCDEEASKGELLHPIQQANARVAEYTGLSIRTITRIRKESSTSEQGRLSSPGKKRPRSIGKCHCTEEEKKVIRNIIHEFYVEKKIVPSAPKLLAAIREKIVFPWELDTLRQLLKSMGYTWKKSVNIRKILIEKPNIVAWRGKYLKAINQYRKANRNIIYIDETWADNTLSFGKCWQSEETLGIVKNMSSSHRYIIVHAGGKSGFVNNALLMFKANSTSGDYHGQMNAINFEKWMTEKLLPNIAPNSVIVMDNAPYHSIQLNRPPSKYARKSDMMDWLLRNNVPYSEDMKKYELVHLIEQHKGPEKIFKADEVLKCHGHIVLRLPPYMCDLNPIELAWALIKRRIRERNPSTLAVDELLALAEEAVNRTSVSEWENFCRHTEDLEKKYWEKDNLLEDAMDEVLSQILDNSEDSEDNSSSSEDV
ncbi:uncharacterized protein LOC122403884 [Colletes gigas]|uniref:uncharacterized protein LOC122403354 n=2 Tax=Colletes gigas TaxID=935657 RepID=UPI001C9AA392|nr:uncharacterized protein LOC122403354 [Colletes gigas]XP_043263005.1 uncharacterized protein LOC122403515 [Colletes gigas]XP_043263614.1 uncharacterized protein LOC122403884 [Colletes gigas]